MSHAPDHASSGFAADPTETGGQMLVFGTTFAVCGPGGDIASTGSLLRRPWTDGTSGESEHGLFVRDTRVLSHWELRVDDHPVEPLGGFTQDPFTGVYVGRTLVRQGMMEPTVLVERRRSLDGTMTEELTLRNHGPEPAGVHVTIHLAADFADLFAVKSGEPGLGPTREIAVDGDTWKAEPSAGQPRSVSVHAPGATVTDDCIAYRVVVEPGAAWRTTLEVSATNPGEATQPAGQRSTRLPVFSSDSTALAVAVSRGQRDIAALALADPDHPDDVFIAAGAPWFMALFGRDSLVTSTMSMAVTPTLALGTVRALARRQGTRTDTMSEEQPGRILHELRFGADVSRAPGGSRCYYGTVDATPLFVMTVGQLARWGVDPAAIDELLPAVDRALEWITRYGDRDGDGFVEYLRGSDRGLRNQGWKDSGDGVTYADGRIADPPIALVEVQAYVYAAFRARSELAFQRGETELAAHWADRAATFKRRFNEAFWLPDRSHYALGLDGDKRPIDSLTSNIGHVLWAGAADRDKAAAIAAHLVSPELFSGYGIRTLATSMGAYNPASYHNGSVWPHDTALCVAGLVRYGFVREAQRVAEGVVEASAFFSGRLPELFCGFDKRELPGPVPYPTSCAPQAWAAAAPVAIMTAMLGLDPDVPNRTLHVAAGVPEAWGAVGLRDVAVGGDRVSVAVDREGGLSVTGGGLSVAGPREALSTTEDASPSA